MTQRIFDIENKKDMTDLWNILPDEVDKIEKYPDGVIDPFAGFCAPSLPVGMCRSLIKINWHDKTEITRPVNYEDMIGCVGWFCDSRENSLLGRLVEYYNGDDFPFSNGDNCYKNFRPAKKSELKFWENEE